MLKDKVQNESLLSPQDQFSLLLSVVGEQIRGQLMGRVLTMIEISMPESSQLTALKDLIRQEINCCDTEVWRNLNQFARDLKISVDHTESVPN